MYDFFSRFRTGLAAFHPRRFPYARFLLALTLGFAGGWAFQWMRMPLPWMLGPMVVLTLCSLAGVPLAAPAVVRPAMSAVIGVMLGSSFKPEVVGQFPAWIATIAGLVAFVAASGAICVVYLRRVARFDPTTAYFSGMPGGLVEMVEVGEEKGGDPRIIALMHSARILLIVMILPFLVQWIEGVSIGNRSALGLSIGDVGWTTEVMLVATAVAGCFLGSVLRLPGRYLIGPMALSALLHSSGTTDFVPPREIVNAAQLVLGTVIGCRFAGADAGFILRILRISFGMTVILLAVTFAFAGAVGALTGHSVVPLLLAYSPGGLAEMSLVALAIHTDVAFVAGHHIARVLLVMASAGPVFQLTGGAGATGRRLRDEPAE